MKERLKTTQHILLWWLTLNPSFFFFLFFSFHRHKFHLSAFISRSPSPSVSLLSDLSSPSPSPPPCAWPSFSRSLSLSLSLSLSQLAFSLPYPFSVTMCYHRWTTNPRRQASTRNGSGDSNLQWRTLISSGEPAAASTTVRSSRIEPRSQHSSHPFRRPSGGWAAKLHLTVSSVGLGLILSSESPNIGTVGLGVIWVLHC